MLLQLSKTVKQSPKSPQIFENNGTFCADRPFSKNRSETNCQKSFVFNQLVSGLQSYILSTTTETNSICRILNHIQSFNRTSFQQQLKLVRAYTVWSCTRLQSYILSTTTETWGTVFPEKNSHIASIVHPFNNNWNFKTSFSLAYTRIRFNRTSFQQQLKRMSPQYIDSCAFASIVHPFNNNWNTGSCRLILPPGEASIVHPFNNNWNTGVALDPANTPISFNRTSFQQQLKHCYL